MNLTVEEMRAGMTAAPPDLARLEAVVTLTENRLKRAKEKLDRAAGEVADATTDLERAKKARADWIENQTDPQLMML